MLLFSVCLPGAFGDWCEQVISRLAAIALGSFVASGANDSEALASDLIMTEGKHFYVSVREPGWWWREQVGVRRKKFVLALDDPREAFRDLVTRRALAPPEAARRIASSCATIVGFVALPSALVLSAEKDWARPEETIARIAEHLGLPVAAADIERLSVELSPPQIRSIDRSVVRLFDENSTLINGAIVPYIDYFRTGSLGQLTWSRELFFADHDQPVTQPIAIGGAVRKLIWGPGIALPPGSWTADIILGFSGDAAGMTFHVEAWTSSKLAVEIIQPSHPGVYPVTIGFELAEAGENRVDLCVINERFAIDGNMSLAYVTLAQRQKVSEAIIERVRNELGLDSPAMAVDEGADPG
jgi:hypothetical protein